MPPKPSAAASRSVSTGKIFSASQRAASGSMRSVANCRAVSRNACWSSVRLKSMRAGSYRGVPPCQTQRTSALLAGRTADVTSGFLADRHQEADAAFDDVAAEIPGHGPEIRPEKQRKSQFRRLGGRTQGCEPLPGFRRDVAPDTDSEAAAFQHHECCVGVEQE